VNEEPVLSAAAIAGAVGAVLAALVSLGVIDLTAEQQAAILAAIVAVTPIAAALWARAQVTPLANPRDVDGEPLSRPGDTLPLAAQARLMREARAEMEKERE